MRESSGGAGISSIPWLVLLSHSLTRAPSGLVVVALKTLLIIDTNDVVTCIDIAAIKNVKRVAECEVRLRVGPMSRARSLTACRSCFTATV